MRLNHGKQDFINNNPIAFFKKLIIENNVRDGKPCQCIALYAETNSNLKKRKKVSAKAASLQPAARRTSTRQSRKPNKKKKKKKRKYNKEERKEWR